MEFRPVDLTAVISILAGLSVVSIPMLGLFMRFALKPFLESYATTFPRPLRSQADFERLERRVKELEEAMSAQALPLPPGERLAMAQRSSLELTR